MRLRPLAVAAAGVLALTLSACEAPKPGVSVFSGSSSDHRPAVCWTDDATRVDLKACLSVSGGGAADQIDALQGAVGEVAVRSDATVGVSVDAEVADRGWYVLLGSNRVNTTPITDSYYRFTLPASVVEAGQPIPMYVFSLAGSDPTVVTGVWTFELVPETGG